MARHSDFKVVPGKFDGNKKSITDRHLLYIILGLQAVTLFIVLQKLL